MTPDDISLWASIQGLSQNPTTTDPGAQLSVKQRLQQRADDRWWSKRFAPGSEMSSSQTDAMPNEWTPYFEFQNLQQDMNPGKRFRTDPRGLNLPTSIQALENPDDTAVRGVNVDAKLKDFARGVPFSSVAYGMQPETQDALRHKFSQKLKR